VHLTGALSKSSSLVRALLSVIRETYDAEVGVTMTEPVVVPRSKLRRQLTDSERAEICRMYVAGATQVALAEQFNLYAATVRNVLTRSGVPLRRHKMVDHQQRQRAIRYYERGLSIRQVAQALGLGRTLVQQILIKEGVPRRPVGGAAIRTGPPQAPAL
jgi:transposase-like protein